MPHHTQVHPPEVVAALNGLIDNRRSGCTVFYDIFTSAEKRRDRSLEGAGLFFMRGRPGALFGTIVPGGRVLLLGHALRGSSGCAADQPSRLQMHLCSSTPFARAARSPSAISPLRCRAPCRRTGGVAAGWSMWGSSTGARMAAAIGTHGSAAIGGDVLPKPATVGADGREWPLMAGTCQKQTRQTAELQVRG